MLTFCDSLAGKLHVIAEEKNEVGDGCCTISGSNLTNTPCMCVFMPFLTPCVHNPRVYAV